MRLSPLAAGAAPDHNLLTQMLQAAPTGVAWFAGPDHRLAFFNERFQATVGGRMQLGQPLAQCLPEMTSQGLIAVLDEVYRTGQGYSGHEVSIELLDPLTGQRKAEYYDLTFQVVRDADGQVQGISSYSTNVSAQVQARGKAEQQLQDQREFYETLLQEIPAGVVAFDPEHRYLYANAIMYERNGFVPAMLGHTNAEVCAARGYSPAVVAERQRHFDEAVRSRRQHIWEETAVGNMGLKHWVRCLRPVFHPDGSLRLVVSSALDMTERHLSEALLLKQQQFTQRIIDTTPNPVYVSDAQGQVMFANAAYATMMANTVQRRALFAHSPALAPEFQQMAQLERIVRESGREAMQNVACTLDSGEIHYCQVTMRPMPQPDGSLHVLTVSTDVTALKQAQRAAAAAAQAQENFLATMSHEIRTPLNGVLGMANVLAKTPLNPEQQRYLEVVQYSGRHLMALLNDVLDMAKIAAGHLTFEQRPFNICDTIEAVLQPLALQAAEKGLAFTIHELGDTCTLPWVMGDEHRLNQIMLNLVGNALKFTQRGGITVKGEQVGATADALTLRFEVSDTGIGITEDQQAHIFDSFAQASADTSRQYGGTGLGLSISRALVLQMGGTFTLDSVVGRGSTFAFTLTLPRVGQPLERLLLSAPDLTVIRGRRVLLVDDNALNLELATAVLNQNGLVVDAALSGTAALALFGQHRYAIVLMDIHMPGMSGLEATARIRQHPDRARAATPVLAMTADAFQAQHEEYYAAGLNDCITKPFYEDELLRKLVALCVGTVPE